MKNPLRIFKHIGLIASCAILMLSCGDAGIGFNVSTEFPVEVPVQIDFPTVPEEIQRLIDATNPDFDPPAEEFLYDLGDVGAFDDAIGELSSSDNIVINSLAYEILNVDANEEAPLDQLSVSLNTAGGAIPIFVQTDAIANQSKTEIPLTESQRTTIINELFSNDRIDASVIFDLSEVPELSAIDFQFVVYFDLTLKARDL